MDRVKIKDNPILERDIGTNAIVSVEPKSSFRRRRKKQMEEQRKAQEKQSEVQELRNEVQDLKHLLHKLIERTQS